MTGLRCLLCVLILVLVVVPLMVLRLLIALLGLAIDLVGAAVGHVAVVWADAGLAVLPAHVRAEGERQLQEIKDATRKASP